MRKFEEICERFQKPQLVVEYDLRRLLKSKSRKNWTKEYSRELREFLFQEEYLEFTFPKIEITEKGQEAKRRGWVKKRAILLILPSIKELLFRSI